MEPVSESELRRSFVNLSKGEARRVNLPSLAVVPWDSLDFLGWRDAKAPQRAYLVAADDDGIHGVALRLSAPRGPRASMCSLCTTVGEVSLMVAPRAGSAGRAGNSVGTYVCTDLACSLYLRGLRRPSAPVTYETLSLDQKVRRLEKNLAAFLARVGTAG